VAHYDPFVDPTLSVVIVLYNSADVLADCLESLRDDLASGWAEVILVDNASPDDSVAVGRSTLPGARHVGLDANLGFAGGANAGIRAATGRYTMLLNPDVRAPTEALAQLVAWMDSNPGIAAASPRLVGSDGTQVFPGRALPSIWRSVLELSRLHKLLPRGLRGRLLQGAYWSGGDQLNVGWVPGTAIIVRRSTTDAAGLLLDDFFMYGEDIEWCHRIGQTAGRIGVCSAVSVVHDWGSSSKLSWGEVEAERRVIAGIASACAVMYGPAHARAIVAVNAVAALLEACMPRRTSEHRRRALALARNWSSCLGVRAPARPAATQSAPERVQ
jgi:N-acetylglucosaminyl-diphospho-decaprenol L-rhamnosyltransferase